MPSYSVPVAATKSSSSLCAISLNKPNLASYTQSSTEHKPLSPSFRGRYDLANISRVTSIEDFQIFTGLSVKLF